MSERELNIRTRAKLVAELNRLMDLTEEREEWQVDRMEFLAKSLSRYEE